MNTHMVGKAMTKHSGVPRDLTQRSSNRTEVRLREQTDLHHTMDIYNIVPSQVGFPQATQIIYPQMQIASASGSLGTVPQQAPGVLQMDQSSFQPASLLNQQAAAQGFHLLQPQSQLLPMSTNNAQTLQAQQVSAQQALLSGQLPTVSQSQMNAQFSVFPQQTQFFQQGQLQGQTTGVPGLSGALMPSYSGQTALLSQNYPLMQTLGHSAADSSAMSSAQIQALGGLGAPQMLTVGQLANQASGQSAMSLAQLQQLKASQQTSTQLLFSSNQSAGLFYCLNCRVN